MKAAGNGAERIAEVDNRERNCRRRYVKSFGRRGYVFWDRTPQGCSPCLRTLPPSFFPLGKGPPREHLVHCPNRNFATHSALHHVRGITEWRVWSGGEQSGCGESEALNTWERNPETKAIMPIWKASGGQGVSWRCSKVTHHKPVLSSKGEHEKGAKSPHSTTQPGRLTIGLVAEPLRQAGVSDV